MLEQLASNLAIQRHPLRMAGCRMGRVVTLVRLNTGKLVVHSTAGFTAAHLEEIRTLGEPGWLVEATNFHDTFARAGREALPDIPYLVPPGFKNAEALGTSSLGDLPAEWGDELQGFEIRGMPKVREHAFYHARSRTLILADLFFNLPASAGRWTHGFLRLVAGIREYPGMSRLFRFLIKDREAFEASMRTLMELDIERIVVAHGDPIVEGAQDALRRILARHGFATADGGSRES